MDEDISTEKKTWEVYNFGKRNVLRLDLNKSREGFCRRGRGRSFHVDGPKTEKAREPTVERKYRLHLSVFTYLLSSVQPVRYHFHYTPFDN